MLKIGDFSKLAQVSVKALRHYGELGLLKPAWIDRFTGYRYYSLDQLPRLNRILALKELGFSLEQIKELLRDDLPAAELRGMIKFKHAEIERLIEEEQARLARVEARLRQIEQEGMLPRQEVVLKTVKPQRVIGIRKVLGSYREVGRLYGELCNHLQGQAVTLGATCPGIAIYYDVEYRDKGMDVEVAAPFTRSRVEGPTSLPPAPRMAVHALPGFETMASLVHQGNPDTLPGAYATMAEWIEVNGYRVIGPNRDVYLSGLEPDKANFITEVQFPVEKKPVSIFITQHKEKGDMEPKIVTKPAFTVVGLKYRGKNPNNEIAQMWGEFLPRMGEIKHMSEPEVSYGVCQDLEPDGTFEYVAGMAVSDTGDIPHGMVSWDVPEQKYAVFTCTLPTIGEAYKYAFESWLPQSGYQRAEGPDFELYPESFDPSVEGSQLYVYVPIK